MPRKPEPSFSLKQIIWDIAASVGTDNLAAIYRELDYELGKLRKDKSEDFYEDTPDTRTVQRIIELDINRLLPEVVVAKLPRHVWHLRNDYEAIKQLAEESIEAEQEAITNAEAVPTFIQHQFEKHLDDLAQTAKILVHHGRRLLRYKDNSNVEAVGDVFSHLSFWWKPNQTILGPGEGNNPTREFAYESQHPIDPYLAGLLYIHYEDKFGKPPFTEWNQLSTENISREITDNLEYLAHGGLEPCPKCSICLQR